MKKGGTLKEAKGRAHASAQSQEKAWQIPRAERQLTLLEDRFWKIFGEKGQGLSLEMREYEGTCGYS